MIASSAPPVLTVEARRVIRASLEHVFAYLARAEHLPRYGSPLWMTAESAEKRGSAQVVTLSGYFAGLPIESLQRVTLRPPVSLDVTQIRGTLRAFAGHCTLSRGEEGTEVLYRLDVDPGIPMVTEDASRQCLVQYLTTLLDRIKLAAERKAPVRRAHVPAPAASGAPAVSEAGDLEAEPDEEPACPEGQVEGPVRPAATDAVRADARAPLPAAAPPPSPSVPVVGQPAPDGQAQGTPARPGAAGSPAGRHSRHRRRRRRQRGGGGGASGTAPRLPA